MSAAPARGRFRLRSLICVTLALVASLVTAASASATVTVGISQSYFDSSIFSHTWWPGLGISTVRAIVPYDIATRSADSRTSAFDTWINTATSQGKAVFVVLGPSELHTTSSPSPGYVAPFSGTYTTAFQAFISKYGSKVSFVGAWNEPNEDCVSVPGGPGDTAHCGPASAHVYLPSSTGNTSATLDGHTANNCSAPTSSNCGYWLAAHYLADAAANTTAQIVAGEFNSDRTASGYWQGYHDEAAALGTPSPTAWSIHGWHDSQNWGAGTCTTGNETNCTLKVYRDWVNGKGGTTTLWDTENGTDVNGNGFHNQHDVADGILNRLDVDQSVSRMYYYDFQQVGSGAVDSGLVDAYSNGGNSSARRQAYKVICTRNGRSDPACVF